MVTVPIAFVLALLCALSLTPVVRGLSRRLGVVDRATKSFRKIHQGEVPRLGGIAILAAFYAPLLGLLLVDSEVGRRFAAEPNKVLGLFAGGAVIGLLGVYDDLRGANAPKKFVVQFGVAIALWALGFHIQALSTPFGFPIDFGFLAPVITVLWIVGVINAVNLIDGLDGLASGIAFFAAATSFVIALVNGNVLMMLFMAALGGAILGFLFFNFNPASIFMGDTGSMFLGFIIAVTSVQTNMKGPTTVAFMVPVLALGLPIMDTLLAMVRRAFRGQSMFQADKEHIHHKLMALGLSHRDTVLILYGVSLVFALVATSVTIANGPQTALILICTLGAVAIFMRRLGYLNIKALTTQAEDLARVRRHNHEVRKVGRKAAQALHKAGAVDDIWAAAQALCEPLALDRLSLTVPDLDDHHERRVYLWETSVVKRGEAFVARYEVGPHGHGTAVVEINWNDGRRALGRDDEIALELLSDHLRMAFERLDRQRNGKRRRTGKVVPLKGPE